MSWLPLDNVAPILGVLVAITASALAFAVARRRGMARTSGRGEATPDGEQRFRALVEGAHDMICVLDATGVITYHSPAAERIFDYTAAELRGRSLLDLVHEADRPRVGAALSRIAEAPGRSAAMQIRCRARCGDPRVIEVAVTNRAHDPAVGGVVANVRDVTERSLLEAQLRQAQKMETIGRLTGGIAHDFNNLLTVIRAHSEIAHELVGTSPARDDLREIRRAADRAAALTRQLLAYSRRHDAEPQWLDLNEVVRDAGAMLCRVMRGNVGVRHHLGADVGLVRADAGQIEQVLLNLVINARDAMPEGGMVELETADAVVCEGERPDLALAPGRYAVLVVRDSGIGMDDATRARIFEPFFTTKEAGRGTGLGLAMVYGIVTRFGGAIDVESARGQGATFRVYLPVVAAVDATRAA